MDGMRRHPFFALIHFSSSPASMRQQGKHIFQCGLNRFNAADVDLLIQ
jgi:hypothetical protein